MNNNNPEVGSSIDILEYAVEVIERGKTTGNATYSVIIDRAELQKDGIDATGDYVMMPREDYDK